MAPPAMVKRAPYGVMPSTRRRVSGEAHRETGSAPSRDGRSVDPT
jgi:hypothetical protein